MPLNNYIVFISILSLSFRHDVNLKLRLLAKRRRKIIQEFTTHIFPVREIFPTPPEQDQGVDPERESLDQNEINVLDYLADAMQTSFVNGRWINTNEVSGEMHYQIVAPLLCSSGDYSAFHAWDHDPTIHPTLETSGTSQSVTSVEVNPAHTISAGLLFTSQLLQHLITILDIVMPFRLRCGEFGASMSEYKFSKSVFRLNVNIMYMCLSQGVSAERLRPKQTLHNLKLLLDNQDTVGMSFRALKQQDYLCQKAAKLFAVVDQVEKTEKDSIEDSEEQEYLRNHDRDIFEEDEEWDAMNDVVDVLTTNDPLSPGVVSPVITEGIASSTISTASNFMSSILKNLTSGTGQ